MKTVGKFVISLDFELFWGVRDVQSLEAYGKNILGVWDMFPQMLQLFDTYDLEVTFAAVGFLFGESMQDVVKMSPELRPSYSEPRLDPYPDLTRLAQQNSVQEKYYLAKELIDLVLKHPRHELATHTFSHFYCLEEGSNEDTLKADLLAAIAVASNAKAKTNSIIFPRNQTPGSALNLLSELGISAYRGNEQSWYYTPSKLSEESKLKRLMRLMDSYLSLSGHNTYDLKEIASTTPYNICSSRFLRPYSRRLRLLEKRRIQRVLNGMTYAAQHGRMYHLWWHPHNFGVHTEENLAVLAQIGEHFQTLKIEYGMESITMERLSKELKEES